MLYIVHAKKRRRGTGIAFVVVMCVLVFLSIIGLGIKYFTRGATRLSETVLASERVTLVAESAITEAWVVIENSVNNHETEFSKSITQKLDGNPGGGFSTTFVPKATKRAFASNSNVTIGDVKIWVPHQLRIWAHNPHEKWGLVCLQVSVNLSLPGIYRTINRTVTQWREFKVVYPSPPVPFNGMSLFVLNPIHLLGYERQYRQLQQKVDAEIKKEEDRLSKKKKFGDVDLPRPFENNADKYAYYPDLKYPPFPYNTRAPKPSDYSMRPPLDVTDMDNHVISFKKELVGEDFKLRWPSNLSDIQNDPLVKQLMAEAEAASVTTSDTPDQATIDKLQQTLTDLKSSDPLKPFETYIKTTLQRYRDNFCFIKEDKLISFGEQYLAPLIRVDTEGTITVDDPIEYYKNHRCTHVFSTEDELWDEVGRGEVFLNGIYYVDGPVTVNMRYRGKGTIISKHHMVVDQCQKADGPDDHFSICTLMSFCHRDGSSPSNQWRSIELNCDVQAGIVAISGLVKNLHKHDLHGSLAVAMLGKEVIDGMGDSAGTTYSWKLTYDPYLATTDANTGEPFYHRAAVVLSPGIIGRSVTRQ